MRHATCLSNHHFFKSQNSRLFEEPLLGLFHPALSDGKMGAKHRKRLALSRQSSRDSKIVLFFCRFCFRSIVVFLEPFGCKQ